MNTWPELAPLRNRITTREREADIASHESENQRLRVELQAAHDASQLPELPGEETRAALNDLQIRVRLKKRE